MRIPPLALSVGTALLAGVAQLAPATASPGPTEKLAVDLSSLDENGLYGPPEGLRSLDYEFCIPTGDAYAQAVRAIDPSVQLFPHSRGRIGCGEHEVLAIGNTHQANHAAILRSLADLDYIERIQPVDWE
ncbi:hypothetical protein [Leptolyngbya sp. KIOST-1]|uniref:hypothetical protein n=1 Tax=Leptolyngbya sp. KIOST-1 TaxID=1229172 RepID=UPI0018CE0095|nr:hypothetical protein [Leptolyngbya sp. KIOST-1]